MIYLVAVFCFLLRAFPRMRNRNVFVSDTYFHLYCAETIREEAFRLPKTLPRVILNHAYSYPYLYHLLLAAFPRSCRVWMEWLTGAVFDTASLLIIYHFAVWGVGLAEPGTYPQNLPIWVASFFAFSPALLRIGSGPRAYNGSPRVPGQFLYLLHLLTGYVGLVTGNASALVVSLLAGAALIVAAKFGTQVLVFFGIWFFALVSYQYFFLLGGCFLLALALTRGKAWNVIMGHIRHSMFYAKYLQAVFLFPYRRTLRTYVGTFLARGWTSVRFLRVWNGLQWYFSERFFLHILITVHPPFLLLFHHVGLFGSLSSLERFMTVWMGAGVTWFLITTLRPLLFLGEAERYLEYALFPSLFMMVATLGAEWQWLLKAFLIYSIVFALFSVWEYKNQIAQKGHHVGEEEDLFNQLNGLSPGVIMPIGSFHYQALFRSRFPVLTHGANVDERLLSYEEFKLVYGNYPYPSERFSEIVDRYGVSYVISDRPSLRHYSERIVEDPGALNRRLDILWNTPTLIVGKVVTG